MIKITVLFATLAVTFPARAQKLHDKCDFTITCQDNKINLSWQ